MSRFVPRLAGVLLLLLGLGCGQRMPEPATSNPALEVAPTAEPPAPESGAGKGERASAPPDLGPKKALLLRVMSFAVMIGGARHFAGLPEISVYADGTAVMQESRRGAGSSPPFVLRLSEDNLESLHEEAARSGLLTMDDVFLPSPRLADGDLTRFQMIADGKRHIARAANLWNGDGDPRRRTLAAFLGFLRDIPTWTDLAGPPKRYEPATFAVLSEQGAAPGAPQGLPIWPLSLGPASAELNGVGCAVFTRDEVSKALGGAPIPRESKEVLVGADKTAILWFRPLLPDERSCADLALTTWGPPPKK